MSRILPLSHDRGVCLSLVRVAVRQLDHLFVVRNGRWIGKDGRAFTIVVIAVIIVVVTTTAVIVILAIVSVTASLGVVVVARLPLVDTKMELSHGHLTVRRSSHHLGGHIHLGRTPGLGGLDHLADVEGSHLGNSRHDHIGRHMAAVEAAAT